MAFKLEGRGLKVGPVDSGLAFDPLDYVTVMRGGLVPHPADDLPEVVKDAVTNARLHGYRCVSNPVCSVKRAARRSP